MLCIEGTRKEYTPITVYTDRNVLIDKRMRKMNTGYGYAENESGNKSPRRIIRIMVEGRFGSDNNMQTLYHIVTLRTSLCPHRTFDEYRYAIRVT
jgi:hypothetical protein